MGEICPKTGARMGISPWIKYTLIGLGTLYICSNFVGKFSKFKREKSRLFEKVMIKADLNHDKNISNSEWEKVYQLTNKNYNGKYSNPIKDLSSKEMLDYLNKF